MTSSTALVPSTRHEHLDHSGAHHDLELIRLWLHGKASKTQREYTRDVQAFLAHTGKTLASTTLSDVVAFVESRSSSAPATRARGVAAVKSLFSFGHRVGYLTVNVAAAVPVPTIPDTLAERQLSEEQVLRMIALESSPRNHALLRTLYLLGCRVSELCSLTWAQIHGNGGDAVATIHGKGGHTRHVYVPATLWAELKQLRGEAPADAPVFQSREGGHLDPSQVHRIVKAAASRAGIAEPVSTHWLRHACASHALDNGAPIHVVQSTLGHRSLTTTTRYCHARPDVSAGSYLRG